MFLKSVAFALLKLTVVVHNSETVPAPELARAQTVAARILRDAGVEVQWRKATPADLDPRPREIPLHLLPLQPATLSPDSGGYAVLMQDFSYAGIAWPQVRRTAAAFDLDEATVLGAVIAHELGHVLLGTKDHAASGVMVPRLGPREIQAAACGELQFLRQEIHRIRAEAARRTIAAQ